MFIPLRVDVPTWRQPWINYALLVVIVLVSLAGLRDEAFFKKWGGIEIEIRGVFDADVRISDELPKPVVGITSTFLHAGYLHLLGNMLFLWVFGNAVNYKFGHVGYVVLYLFCGLAGSMAHYAFTDLPAVGASGAINGVMGAFVVFFPRNEVTLMCIWSPARRFTVSSFWVILMWVAWDVLYLCMGARIGVALWAHVGGFAAGFGVALLCAATRLIRPTPDEQTLLQVFGLAR